MRLAGTVMLVRPAASFEVFMLRRSESRYESRSSTIATLSQRALASP